MWIFAVFLHLMTENLNLMDKTSHLKTSSWTLATVMDIFHYFLTFHEARNQSIYCKITLQLYVTATWVILCTWDLNIFKVSIPRSLEIRHSWYLLSSSSPLSDRGVLGERSSRGHELLLLAGAEGVHQGHQHQAALPENQHSAGTPDGQGAPRPHSHPQGKTKPIMSHAVILSCSSKSVIVTLIGYYWINMFWEKHSLLFLMNVVSV